jgi:hypothetical protein
MSKHQDMFFSDLVPVTSSGFVVAADGTITLAKNLSAKVAVVRLGGLKDGDIINRVSVLGSIGATTGKTTTLAYDLRKVTHGSGVVTDASIKSSTTGALAADADLEVELDLVLTDDEETVGSDSFYYVKLTGTTQDDNACDIAIAGVRAGLERA